MIQTDTQPEAERIQLELFRKSSSTQRLQLVSSLTGTVFSLSWQGLCERTPDESLKQRVERFVFLLYGNKDLAEKFSEQYIKTHNKEPRWITR